MQPLLLRLYALEHVRMNDAQLNALPSLIERLRFLWGGFAT
jgi:hypothetical protein